MEATTQLAGNVGSEIEFRDNGVPVASLRLAHTPRERRGTEWVDGTTTWITVKAFFGLAENLSASLSKGDPVVVVGKLRTVTWEKEGLTQSRFELVADTVGHDLRRGTARFTRTTRTTAEGTDDTADASGGGGHAGAASGEVRAA